MRVMHFITGLEAHGAERMLARLVTSLADSEAETVVVSLTTEGPVGAELSAAGIEVVALQVDKVAAAMDTVRKKGSCAARTARVRRVPRRCATSSAKSV